MHSTIRLLLIDFMYQKINLLCTELEQNFDSILPERKAVLQNAANFIRAKLAKGEEANIVYICTHNSRRSHYGQIAAAMASRFYGVNNIHSFSGGTEVSAFHPNAIEALRSLGFVITAESSYSNPAYKVSFGTNDFTTCYSKVYSQVTEQLQDFVAVMTCDDADQNCPFIPNASLRISTPYEDPKKSDGTILQSKVYETRFKEIATEVLYLYHLLN